MTAAAPLYAVTMVDTRTDQPHRVGGRVQTRFTHDPEDARRHFLHNRDPRLWRIVVTPLTRHGKAVAPPGAATDQSVPVPATAG